MALGAALMLAACFDPKAQAMQLAGVTPFTLSKHVDTQVALNGNFYVEATVDFGTGKAPRVNDAFTASLDDVALQNVTYQDSATLTATVPAGTLANGLHTLTVNAPDGTSATLEHAVMVNH